jgi:hypothetical protein
MKRTTLLTFFLASILFADNEIYIDQVGNTGTYNLTQIGDANSIGTGDDIAYISGDSNVFTITQIGNANSIAWDSVGNATLVDIYTEGNFNLLDVFMSGNQNDLDINIVGSSNSLKIEGYIDGNTALIANQDFDLNVNGTGNSFDYSLNDTAFSKIDYTVLGGSNQVASIQEGNPGGVGHTQIVDIAGSNNSIDIHQSGLNSQILELTHVGSDTTFTVIQSDGYYNTTDITPPLNPSSSTIFTSNTIQP